MSDLFAPSALSADSGLSSTFRCQLAIVNHDFSESWNPDPFDYADSCSAECRQLSFQIVKILEVRPIDRAALYRLSVQRDAAGKRWNDALVAIGAFK